jgi:hypothetical protein
MSLTFEAIFEVSKADFEAIFSREAKDFISQIGLKFLPRIKEILDDRKVKKATLNQIANAEHLKDHLTKTAAQVDQSLQWKIKDLPDRLTNRHIDAGDVSPACLDQLERCLATCPSQLQGIQVRVSIIRIFFLENYLLFE